MESREASRVKRARLLNPNQISEIVMDLDSDEAQYDASSKEDEEVEQATITSFCHFTDSVQSRFFRQHLRG